MTFIVSLQAVGEFGNYCGPLRVQRRKVEAHLVTEKHWLLLVFDVRQYHPIGT